MRKDFCVLIAGLLFPLGRTNACAAVLRPILDLKVSGDCQSRLSGTASTIEGEELLFDGLELILDSPAKVVSFTCNLRGRFDRPEGATAPRAWRLTSHVNLRESADVPIAFGLAGFARVPGGKEFSFTQKESAFMNGPQVLDVPIAFELETPCTYDPFAFFYARFFLFQAPEHNRRTIRQTSRAVLTLTRIVVHPMNVVRCTPANRGTP